MWYVLMGFRVNMVIYGWLSTCVIRSYQTQVYKYTLNAYIHRTRVQTRIYTTPENTTRVYTPRSYIHHTRIYTTHVYRSHMYIDHRLHMYIHNTYIHRTRIINLKRPVIITLIHTLTHSHIDALTHSLTHVLTRSLYIYIIYKSN
jgi:hypothetical protein